MSHRRSVYISVAAPSNSSKVNWISFTIQGGQGRVGVITTPQGLRDSRLMAQGSGSSADQSVHWVRLGKSFAD
ncbi:hypothetical protein E2C01_007458 [Portunus trituberculatus]|uniref:Uncharacterized protein n=1 Tax=Portunus trituberculatus TaxID=210409 RepID=A0A5B7CXZ2_PORTR|nr:hypothetical protein [Portunus trituberculatus]